MEAIKRLQIINAPHRFCVISMRGIYELCCKLWRFLQKCVFLVSLDGAVGSGVGHAGEHKAFFHLVIF